MNEIEDGNGHEDRNRGGNGSGNGDENREKGVGEKEPRYTRGTRGGIGRNM